MKIFAVKLPEASRQAEYKPDFFCRPDEIFTLCRQKIREDLKIFLNLNRRKSTV